MLCSIEGISNFLIFNEDIANETFISNYLELLIYSWKFDGIQSLFYLPTYFFHFNKTKMHTHINFIKHIWRLIFIFFQINGVLSAIPTLQSWTGDDENESKLNVAITELSMHLLKEEFKQRIKVLFNNIMYWAHFYSM